MIHYHIQSKNPEAHYFDIELHIPVPDPAGQVVRMPAWIPGSYMIRDFARNIIEIAATSEGQVIGLTQLDKSSWLIEASDHAIDICYRVYAWDLSVRSAHLDTTHGFFNGSSVFLEVVGQSDAACEVTIVKPGHSHCSNWQLATTLERKSKEDGLDDFSFGEFLAEDYETLIDHPVEMGDFTRFDFMAAGVRHDVVLTGRFECDIERLRSDLIKICEHHIEMFGHPIPVWRYMFLVMVVGEGYGGLEHRSSTSLLCSRHDLPKPGQSESSEQYRNFLGLCSHEYFHSWNVKRIKPAVFDKPDLSTEVYTPLLWAFEGITSYYDDLALVRSGCISTEGYLDRLAQVVTRVRRTPGRKRQSAAESSFNAWTRFYKQDENAANSIVSYYAKGSLIALCIDLKIRELTAHRKSLDDVMRILWKDYQTHPGGIRDSDIQKIVCDLVGEDITPFLHSMIYGTEELAVKKLLKNVAIGCDYRASIDQQDKGGKANARPAEGDFGAIVKEAPSGLTVVSVKESAAAQSAGLSAGDEIISINGLRANMKLYQEWVKLSAPGSEHKVMAFRRDELMAFDVVMGQPELDCAVLVALDESSDLFKNWLHIDVK